RCPLAVMPELVCWKCGASLAALSLPLRRQDECRACGAALHACKLCEFYDVTVAKHCREPIAEIVREKDRANYCDYFKPRPGAYSTKRDTEAGAAKAQLDALFGGSTAGPSAADDVRRKLDDLFKKG
ncbi:MAG TPA: hypothetical protein VJS42_05875, partial [Steroidobacteraceae bacterium]|nr:hypothetical protein [Steroidobacteraceae bacterium]